MHQKDIERFAFLYLCGQRDRELLNGKTEMTFESFQRIIYITDLLGLDNLNLEIWNRFSAQFKKQLKALEKLNEEPAEGMELEEYEDGGGRRDKWTADFCREAPDEEAYSFLVNTFDIDYEIDK